ncbi:MAG: hypothetical protein WCK90_03865 [archaeon]
MGKIAEKSNKMSKEGSSKAAFWQALLFTLLVFGIGFLIGFFVEGMRSEVVTANVMNSEISLLDEQLRPEILNNFPVECAESRKSIFSFADRVYWDALKLEEYDGASNFKQNLDIVHKRYDLLRLIIWTESISLKRQCNESFSTIVYFYDYNSEDTNTKAEQVSVARVLGEFKSRNPSNVLLLPIATNLNLSSVNLVLISYNITSSPSVVINEKSILSGVFNSSELETVIFENRNK